jgi:hypothetical protein
VGCPDGFVVNLSAAYLQAEIVGYAETTRAIDGLRQRVFKHKDIESTTNFLLEVDVQEPDASGPPRQDPEQVGARVEI